MSVRGAGILGMHSDVLIPAWWVVVAVVVIALLVFWAVEVTDTTAVDENPG